MSKVKPILVKTPAVMFALSVKNNYRQIAARPTRDDGASQYKVQALLKNQNSNFQSMDASPLEALKAIQAYAATVEGAFKKIVAKITAHFGSSAWIGWYIKNLKAKIAEQNEIIKNLRNLKKIHVKKSKKYEGKIGRVENKIAFLKREMGSLEAIEKMVGDVYWDTNDNVSEEFTPGFFDNRWMKTSLKQLSNRTYDEILWETHPRGLAEAILDRQKDINYSNSILTKLSPKLMATKLVADIAVKDTNDALKEKRELKSKNNYSGKIRTAHKIKEFTEYFKSNGLASAFMAVSGLNAALKATKTIANEVVSGFTEKLEEVAAMGDVATQATKDTGHKVPTPPFSSLTSSWLASGAWNKATSSVYFTTKPSAGKTYHFIVYNINESIWNQIRNSEGAGTTLWDTAWNMKRTKSVNRNKYSGIASFGAGDTYHPWVRRDGVTSRPTTTDQGNSMIRATPPRKTR